MKNKNSHVLEFQQIDRTKVAIVGGKGTNLIELTRIDGVEVPDGFCVTTEAYKEVIGKNVEFDTLLRQLTQLKMDDRKCINGTSARIRKVNVEIL